MCSQPPPKKSLERSLGHDQKVSKIQQTSNAVRPAMKWVSVVFSERRSGKLGGAHIGAPRESMRSHV